jgi:hypothetical protein
MIKFIFAFLLLKGVLGQKCSLDILKLPKNEPLFLNRLKAENFWFRIPDHGIITVSSGNIFYVSCANSGGK